MEHVTEPGPRKARAAGPIQPPPRRRLTVADVMSSRLVTVTPDSGFKQMAALMRGRRISGLPVVDGDGRPLGVVSETDLLAKERRTPLPLLSWLRPGWARDHLRAQGTTAGEVMTAPAETVPLHATVVAAARRLQDTGLRRLLVVDRDGRLAGLVTRNDLLRAFLRPDEEIRADVEGIVQRCASAGRRRVRVSVREGLVTLRGSLPSAADIEVVAELTRLTDGVIDVDVDGLDAEDGDLGEPPRGVPPGKGPSART